MSNGSRSARTIIASSSVLVRRGCCLMKNEKRLMERANEFGQPWLIRRLIGQGLMIVRGMGLAGGELELRLCGRLFRSRLWRRHLRFEYAAVGILSGFSFPHIIRNTTNVPDQSQPL